MTRLIIIVIAILLLLTAGASAQDNPAKRKPTRTPTSTVTATNTAVPPTATETATVEIPTETPVPPTDTPVVETATPEPTICATPQCGSGPPPADTPLPATDTPIPAATATDTPAPTVTVTTTATATPTVTPTPGANQPAPHISGPTLVSAYWMRDGIFQPDYGDMKYQPRQWTNGVTMADATNGAFTVPTVANGTGCDAWYPANYGVWMAKSNPNLFTFRLTRDSTVYVIWRESLTTKPAWIDGSYTRVADQVVRRANGTTATYFVFKTVVQAGDRSFGSSWDVVGSGTRNLPWFVFCEADGSATMSPGGGIAPNTPCPQSLHDAWVTTGPDGNVYPTWHPQIDPTYWCYYGHEHGSDPASFDPGWHPAFGYTATRMGMSEAHAGFKVYVVTDATGTYTYGIVHHFGTAGAARYCVSHHTAEFRVKSLSSGAIVADITIMANFGSARNNDSQELYSPTACPNQGSQATGTGVRLIPVTGGTGYEPWRADFIATVMLTGSFTWNTPDGVATCVDMVCSAVTVTGDSGTTRFITANDDFGIVDPIPGSNDGVFCTDPTGTAMVHCDTAGAIRQYVADGLVIDAMLAGTNGVNGHTADEWGWGFPYYPLDFTPAPVERENSIPPGAAN